MTERRYEYIVVGKGLMGAAAARHLSAHSPNIALVGPDEPADRPSHGGVFGSHYDEGRITRILDPDRIWALLAQLLPSGGLSTSKSRSSRRLKPRRRPST